jgi:hypothetical protein
MKFSLVFIAFLGALVTQIDEICAFDVPNWWGWGPEDYQKVFYGNRVENCRRYMPPHVRRTLCTPEALAQ